VAGNYIGTDVTGAAALANGNGVTVRNGARANLIGVDVTSADPAAGRNIVSGNTNNGVLTYDVGENAIVGNYIGTDATGTVALGNGQRGVLLDAGSQNVRVGTDGDGIGDNAERNVISGNIGDGVDIRGSGTNGNVVAGNYIGTDVTGTIGLGNGQQGVAVSAGAQGNRIGTDGDGVADAAERNIISGNNRAGVAFHETTSANVVQGNLIGTDVTGTEAMGNGLDGVLVRGTDHLIGGTEPGAANTIAFNGGAGVTVLGDTSIGNTVRGNSIHSNGGLGIDLGGDGVTPNDPLDEDTGPNNLQNFPVITSARPGSLTQVVGTLHSTPNSTFTVDFYANAAPDPSGHGQGARWLGSAVVTTNEEGNAALGVVLDAATAPGEWIAATATAADGGTSEFSAAVAVEALPVHVVGIVPVVPDPRNSPVSAVDVEFSEAIDPASFSNDAVTLTLNGEEQLLVVELLLSEVGEPVYRIGGLDLLTGADGTYVLTVHASELTDPLGNAGEGAVSVSWLMDTVAPISKVDRLPRRATSLAFEVSAAGSDPAMEGVTPSGVESYDLFVTVDGAPFEFWTTVSADDPVALFTAESNHSYGFRSVARDRAANVESKPVSIETSIYVPDLDAPQTQVTSVDAGSPTFVLQFSGTDTGGSGLETFELYVAVDGGEAQKIAAVNAGPADGDGLYHGTATFQAIADGAEHTYQFFTVGIDRAGNVEEPTATFDVSAGFPEPAELEIVSFVVQQGMTQRSYIRYLEITFNQPDELQAMIDSLADGNGATDRIRLRHVDEHGGLVGMVLDVSMLAITGHTITIDFGEQGIGGDRNSIAGDGFYELAFDFDGDGHFDARENFHRLLGDVTGDRQVGADDLDRVFAAWGASGSNIEEDVNGDGAVTIDDVFTVWGLQGRMLDEGLLGLFED